MDFTTGKDLLEICNTQNIKISDAMRRRELAVFNNTTLEEINIRMQTAYQIMKNSVKKALTEDLQSMGGLIGGESKKIYNRISKNPLCGSLISKAICYSMGVLEVNCSMGLIVAAPTAGASGVIPGVLIAMQEEYKFTDDQMVDALFTAGAVGYLFTLNATVSGAEGGCQAETGVASAMAAAAICELLDGTPAQCLAASCFAIENLMGLVCDPIAGLVELPCQRRNASAASNAFTAAEIAMSTVINTIPFDEVVDAMYRVGKHIPMELRETALGGLANTPTACEICHKIFGNNSPTSIHHS